MTPPKRNQQMTRRTPRHSTANDRDIAAPRNPPQPSEPGRAFHSRPVLRQRKAPISVVNCDDTYTYRSECSHESFRSSGASTRGAGSRASMCIADHPGPAGFASEVPRRQRSGPAIRRDCRGCNPVAGLWVVHPRFIVPVPDNLRKCRPSHCDGRADWVLPFGRCHRSGDKEKRIWRRPVESPASWAFAP